MKRVLVVGAGKWALEHWAPLLRAHADHVQVVGVVDIDPVAARAFASEYGDDVPTFSALHEGAAGADACIVLTPPEHHAQAIEDAAAMGLPVLTEKPLATSWSDLSRILTATRDTIPCAVVQNYRYEGHIQRVRQVIRDSELGPVNLAYARFGADYRVPGSWDVGDAHNMPNPLLVEASIHHVDMLRYLTGLDITGVTAATNNPAATSFTGGCLGVALFTFDGGVVGHYEGNLLAAGDERRWHREEYRIECADGSISCVGNDIWLSRANVREQLQPADGDARWGGHAEVLRQFFGWLDGGAASETRVEDNARSAAAVLGAIDASATGQWVDVRGRLADLGLAERVIA